MVFHAGTAAQKGRVLTSGGRVLGVTALGRDIPQAMERAYQGVSLISWDGVHYRKDIGSKANKHLETGGKVPNPKVGIFMGSDSDLETMELAAKILQVFNIPYEMHIASAHRSPGLARNYAMEARDKGLKVLIAGAGMAAHLAGFLAAHTTLPVIGVPLATPPLKGLDALLSTVQMPPGVPVATMGVGSTGAKNAGLLAVQILALEDERLHRDFLKYKENLYKEVKKKDQALAATAPAGKIRKR
jgi:phosphoribosylamine--glycine ligase